MKNLIDFEHIPKILNEPIFEKAFKVAELANLSREQYTTYERNLLDYWTTKAVLDTAREKGWEEGMEKSMEEGLEKGREASKKEIAAILKQKGLSPEQIAEITSLSMDEIKDLRTYALTDSLGYGC